MTIEEFDKTKWTGGMMATYGVRRYEVISCDFMDRTITLECEDGEFTVSCEEVELIGEYL